MKLVLIPAGTFTMGSPKTEMWRGWYEGPQRKVTITKPFYMGIYEVTQEQYEAVVGKNPAKLKGAKNPVQSVSWDDGVAFCKALSKKTRKTVRLPTEAEWEYACRAGAKTAFCFGDDQKQLGDYAWYDGNSGSKTHPVGQKKPNAWGLHDMHGNVYEWCSDWYGDSYANAKAVDPQGAASGSGRVLRGGYWGSYKCGCRSAFRFRFAPSTQWNLIGFRVVVVFGRAD
ncbi:MAG: formylglycine-generating enzyme family protein [Phycisphaerae bacterium]|nr:formylglycine-generating enzyme family protein [Phycisphaerae bacterium]